jgi:hypothetical protein
MLQVFYLDIAKIELVLHMLQIRPTCHKALLQLHAGVATCVTVMHLWRASIGEHMDSHA